MCLACRSDEFVDDIDRLDSFGLIQVSEEATVAVIREEVVAAGHVSPVHREALVSLRRRIASWRCA